MAGVKSVSFTSPYAAEESEIERRRALAMGLQQKADAPMGPTEMIGGWAIKKSPWEGAAKLAQGLSAGYQGRQADSMQKALQERRQGDRTSDMSALAAMLRGEPGSPAPADDLGGGPAMPAQHGGRVDPAQMGNLRTPEMQNMAMQMWGQQMQRDTAPPQRVDLGDKIGLLNPQGQIVGYLPKGATPDAAMREAGSDRRHAAPSGSAQLGAQTTLQTHATPSGSALANNAVTMRGQNMVDSRTREQMERDKFGQPMEVTGPNGPMLAMQNKGSGVMVDANTRQPVADIGPKVGETAQKQQTGVATTKDAITEYRNALKNWSAQDIANPNARARMGTIYNNMLLQAKEAYNLGVLNGPDYMILQQVITNPATMTGGITSKKALDDQATKLDEIMTKVGATVSQTQSGRVPQNRRASDDPLGIRK